VGMTVVFNEQKTAYEVVTSLEFRRVLFRSDDDALATVNIAGPTDITEGDTGTFTVTRSGGDKDQAASVKLALVHGDTDAADFDRSEERRVGKECWARWSPGSGTEAQGAGSP